MVPAIIDIEASGIGRGSYPIEIGLALPDGKTHCFLVRPELEWTRWDREAEAMHGLNRAVLEAQGRGAPEVARRLNDLLQGGTVYSDGWGFDSTWLAALFDAAGMMQRFRVEPLSALLDDAQKALWDAVRVQVEDDIGVTRHRASTDALILQLTYVRTSTLVEATP